MLPLPKHEKMTSLYDSLEYEGMTKTQLIYVVLKNMIEKTKGNIKAPIQFREVYRDACRKNTKSKYDYSNLEFQHHIKDILLRNGYIFVDFSDVERVFITKKA